MTTNDPEELDTQLGSAAQLILGQPKGDKAMTTRNPVDLETQLLTAADDLKNLESANDVKKWWNKYYYTLGHKRLGRLLLGQSVERLLERASGNRGDD